MWPDMIGSQAMRKTPRTNQRCGGLVDLGHDVHVEGPAGERCERGGRKGESGWSRGGHAHTAKAASDDTILKRAHHSKGVRRRSIPEAGTSHSTFCERDEIPVRHGLIRSLRLAGSEGLGGHGGPIIHNSLFVLYAARDVSTYPLLFDGLFTVCWRSWTGTCGWVARMKARYVGWISQASATADARPSLSTVQLARLTDSQCEPRVPTPGQRVEARRVGGSRRARSCLPDAHAGRKEYFSTSFALILFFKCTISRSLTLSTLFPIKHHHHGPEQPTHRLHPGLLPPHPCTLTHQEPAGHRFIDLPFDRLPFPTHGQARDMRRLHARRTPARHPPRHSDLDARDRLRGCRDRGPPAGTPGRDVHGPRGESSGFEACGQDAAGGEGWGEDGG